MEWRLVNAAGTKASYIKFLKRNDVGLTAGDHTRDPPWVCFPICPNASVYIVGHDARHGGSRLQRFVGNQRLQSI